MIMMIPYDSMAGEIGMLLVKSLCFIANNSDLKSLLLVMRPSSYSAFQLGKRPKSWMYYPVPPNEIDKFDIATENSAKSLRAAGLEDVAIACHGVPWMQMGFINQLGTRGSPLCRG